jgi:hypothetical protein
MKRVLVLIAAALFATAAVAAPPKYVCWDGTTVKTPTKCPAYKLPVVCPDGTVVSDPVKCPPLIVCPDGTITHDQTTCPPLPPVDSAVAK